MKDVKIILSVLWIARMLTGFLGDVIRFFEHGIIEGIITGELGGMQMTHEMLFFMALLMELPIVMVVLSLILSDKANRWANIVVAGLLFSIDFIGLIVATSPYVYIVVGVGLVFNLMTIWYAWKWPETELSIGR